MMGHIFRYLDTNGDGTGTKNANGDYSVTPDDFYIQPPAGEVYVITRMLVGIEDGNGALAEEYGHISALTNGVVVFVTDRDTGGSELELTDGVNVKSNAGWANLCHDVVPSDWGSGNDHISARWTFTNSGKPLTLVGSQGHNFGVRLNDDLTGLIAHYFHVQGYTL